MLNARTCTSPPNPPDLHANSLNFKFFHIKLIIDKSGFIREGFIPSVRPGARPDCYLGALKVKECPPKEGAIPA